MASERCFDTCRKRYEGGRDLGPCAREVAAASPCRWTGEESVCKLEERNGSTEGEAVDIDRAKASIGLVVGLWTLAGEEQAMAVASPSS